MREDVKVTKVYSFDELSDAAKEKARDWWRECESSEFGSFGDELEFAETAAQLLGIELDTRPVKLMGGGTRQESIIYWSGFSSQGDGASFKARYGFAVDSPAKVRAEFGRDEALWKIADDLADLQAKNGNSLTGEIDQRGNYVHAHTMYVDWTEREDGEDVSENAEEDLQELMREFANWIYKGLRDDYEYRMSEENVDDAIRANEYEFTESGKIY